jgi:hypothetical protein
MPADDADRLGPKGHVYVELVREQYRAPLERGTARRALLTALLGVLLIVFGAIGTFIVYGESVILVAVGLVAFVSALPELRGLRPEFEEARRIGWVEATFDDSSVTVGEPATFRAVLHARRNLDVRAASLTAAAQPWHGSKAGEVALSLALPVSITGAKVIAGDDWRTTVTFRIPSDAPPSYYSATDSVRWTMTLTLEFANASPWQRTWPMLVFPADSA